MYIDSPLVNVTSVYINYTKKAIIQIVYYSLKMPKEQPKLLFGCVEMILNDSLLLRVCYVRFGIGKTQGFQPAALMAGAGE